MIASTWAASTQFIAEGVATTRTTQPAWTANAATELRGEPDHPAQAKIAQHRQALRQVLEDLAKTTGAYDPAVLAGQLLILVEGAIAGALIDRRPGAARHARVARSMVAASTRLGGRTRSGPAAPSSLAAVAASRVTSRAACAASAEAISSRSRSV